MLLRMKNLWRIERLPHGSFRLPLKVAPGVLALQRSSNVIQNNSLSSLTAHACIYQERPFAVQSNKCALYTRQMILGDG